VFIRFSGCNLKCPFCDTDFHSYTEMTTEDILSAIRKWKDCGFVVLTGGEPSLQVDEALTEALHEEGFYIAMETNGTRPIPRGIDWVTVSPKNSFVEHAAEIIAERADELKVIFDGVVNPSTLHLPPSTLLYLQPCDTGDEARNREITRLCVEYIKQHPEWRLSLQTHKLINIP
jgi:organic radical activating enzyme